MYKIRHLEGKLRLMAQAFKIILITGARQVGKSTLLEHVFPHIPSITFDPIQDIHQARRDPDLFFQQFPSPLILDEIQYAPELLPLLKRLVDKHPANGQYFLTGSHNLNVLKSVAESLAGRVGILDLSSMTTYEQADAIQFNEHNEHTPPLWLEEYLQDPAGLPQKIAGTTNQLVSNALWRGGLPGTLPIPDQLLPEYFSGYLQTYIQRDIRTLINIQNLTEFQEFVGLISALTGQELNYAQLGREVDINPKTARAWLSILQHGYQWRE